MSSLCLLAAGVLVNGTLSDATQPKQPLIQPDNQPGISDTVLDASPQGTPTQTTAPDLEASSPEFSTQCNSAQTTRLKGPIEGIQAVAEVAIEPTLIRDPILEQFSSWNEGYSTPKTGSTKPNTQPKPTPKTVSPAPDLLKVRPEVTPNKAVSPAPNLLKVRPEVTPDLTEFSRVRGPASGSQLYLQRLAALKAGKLYTRVSADSFRSVWMRASDQPTYQQWQRLLAQEARAAAKGKGSNRMAVLVGDSLSLWFPSSRLPSGQFWLNQGISGDTSAGILKRLSAFAQTRVDTIYILAGINDLRRGASDHEVLSNLRQVIQRSQQLHPQAQIVVQSILPTNLSTISNNRIRSINQRLAAIAQEQGVSYLDLYSLFMTEHGNLNPGLTTDGLHLNPRGYEVWQWALTQTESRLAAIRNQRQASRLTSQSAPETNLSQQTKQKIYQSVGYTLPEAMPSLGWSS